MASGGTIGSGGTITSQGGAAGSSGTGTGGAPGWYGQATGVAVLTVPLTATGQGQRYNYQNFDGTGSSYDLTGATLTIVACAPNATGGNLHVFFTTSARADSIATDVALSTLTAGFTTIRIPVPAAVSGGFDPATLILTRIEVEAGSAFGTSWQTPATMVYIDSISTSNGRFNDTLGSTFDPMQSSGARPLTGSSLTWLNSYTR
jgi:hypothetical protein